MLGPPSGGSVASDAERLARVDWSERYNGEVVRAGRIPGGSGVATGSTTRTATRVGSTADDGTPVTTAGSTTPGTTGNEPSTVETTGDRGTRPFAASEPAGDLRVALGGSRSRHGVTPGDHGAMLLEVEAVDRPIRTWLSGRLVADDENGLTEPERKDPDENGGPPGELGDALRVVAWLDDGDGDLETGGGRSPVEGLFEAVGIDEADAVLATGSLVEVLPGPDGPLLPVTDRPDAPDPRPTCLSPGSTIHVGFAWRLPVDHANEVQTDAVAFDLGVVARDCDATAGVP